MAYHSLEEDEDESCWICFESTQVDDINPLYMPCKCPRIAHKFCIAKWQLTSRKQYCGFCNTQYDDWKSLTYPSVLQPYYNIPSSIKFAFHVKSNEYKIPIQTHPSINVKVVMETFNMLIGTQYTNVNFVSCKVRDPFTKDIIIVHGKDGLESTVHFVLIGKAYERYLSNRTKVSVWRLSVERFARKIQNKVNRFIGSTPKNERLFIGEDDG